jgi:predicted DNA-binding transcriptional regulator YafY
MQGRDNILALKAKDFRRNFLDEDTCLDWLKNQLYPDGINCPVCKKITRHHKLQKRPCYCCDHCGHHLYPTSGTIFYRSTTSLKTWFEIISKISESKHRISVKDIQREYRITYKTAWRIVKKIKEFIETDTFPINIVKTNGTDLEDDKCFYNKKVIQNQNNVNVTNLRRTALSNREIDPFHGGSKGGYARQFYSKRDRTARLLKLQMLLCQNPEGLEVKEISDKCYISKRTVYRDLRALEFEMNIPIWQNGSKRGIVEGYFLPPINITLAEATTLFLTARLIQNYFMEYDPNIASLFLKLNTITPMPLKNDIQHILEYLEKQPRDLRKVKNFNTLINAWISRRKVRVTTRAHNYEEPVERIIEPYMIEPSAIGGASYVIAFCNLKKAIYAFKIEHIIGEIIMLQDTYEIPEDFDPIGFLNSAWGVQLDQTIQTIKLHFNQRISRTIMEEEDKIHSSQINELQPDGSLIMSLKVRDYIHIRSWIMKWGDEVEVIEPETLRNQIRDTAQSILNIYPKLK